jgi:hypothetical protein
MFRKAMLMFWIVSDWVFKAPTKPGSVSMIFLGISTLHMDSSIFPHLAASDPSCGVPRKTMP